jgi:hypothetical protein
MPEPGSIQKKPAAPGASVGNAAADSIAPGSNPEASAAQDDSAQPRELGGPTGPEPTRYGDWERKGRCIDF